MIIGELIEAGRPPNTWTFKRSLRSYCFTRTAVTTVWLGAGLTISTSDAAAEAGRLGDLVDASESGTNDVWFWI